MSLSDILKKKTVKVERVTIDEVEFVVTGKTKSERAALMASNRRKNGTLDGDKFDSQALADCVTLAEDGTRSPASDWDIASSHITGPLTAVVMSVCGFDKDDIQRDPKDSDSTES